MNSHLIHHSGQVNDYVIGNNCAHKPESTTNWAHEVSNLSLSTACPFYYNPLEQNFDFPCLRFVDIHGCPAMRTGRSFLARRAAVLHWSWP